MGYKVNESIVLLDSIKGMQEPSAALNEAGKTAYAARAEYALLQSQQKLNELQLKRYRLTALPTLVGYGNFVEQAQRTSFDFFDADKKWYPIGIVGATLMCPFLAEDKTVSE